MYRASKGIASSYTSRRRLGWERLLFRDRENVQSIAEGRDVCNAFIFVSDIGIIEGLTQNDAQSEFISYDINDFFPLTPIQSPAVVVNRCTYEQLGGFRSDMNYVIDLEMWLRVVATRGVRYSPQVLAYYRQSMDNGTHRLIQHGDNLRDLERFCRFAINEYPNLSSIDWENKLRDLALRQELYCTQKGMTDSARIASQFWHEHSSFLQRLKRFLFGFIRR